MFSKKLLLLLFFFVTAVIVSAQQKQKNYTSEWKKIDSLIQKAGLLKSALTDINAIYADAKKDNNNAQVIKALLYKLSVNDQLSEQAKIENIRLLEVELAASKEPARSILHSITAGAYWQYLQVNRWRFYDRTKLMDNKSSDIDNWSLADLHQKISSHYLLSLVNDKILKQTRLEPYDAIIMKGNVRHLRPTLFDLLAHRALEYFANDERDINKPAYAFEISDSMAFADARAFASHRFETNDSLSLHHKAMQIYQHLITFHLNDRQPQALLDADISRLTFVNQYSAHPDKSELYKIALEKMIVAFPDVEGIAGAMYLLAEWYRAKGGNYDPVGDTANRYALVQAKEWCEKALRTKHKTEGKTNARNLLHSLTAKEVRVETEKVNIPGDPFRMLVTYRNVNGAFFRVIATNRTLKEATRREPWNESSWKRLLAAKPVYSFNSKFPETNDLQHHRTELKVNGLAPGEYALIASSDKNFPLNKASLAVSYFHVSAIAYIRQGHSYYVAHRTSGAPLPGASVQLWKEQYNYVKKSYELNKAEKFTTDRNGFFSLEKMADNKNDFNYRLEITYKKDRLFLDDYKNHFTYGDEVGEPEQEISFLFTDRALYRPGQTVFFKGIVVTKDRKQNKNSVLTNRKSFIHLVDANNEVVDSIQLTTNDYGSYTGKFTLPAGLLNGEFTIKDVDNESQVNIRVEEYKRPKFYVDISKPGTTYRLSDSIYVNAKALAYAGNNINGATVNYRVVRKTNFPMWTVAGFHKMIWPPYPRQEMEIAHGTTKTGSDGSFTIPFMALPDKTIPREHHPVFNYELTADVTDINGETRSGSTMIAVAYEALQLSIDIPAQVSADSLKTVNIRTTNMNDSFVSANVQLAIYKLRAPQKIFRNRYWSQPDQFVMNREEYYANFPFDVYSNELDMQKWEKEKQVFQATAATKQGSGIQLPLQSLESGWYLFEGTTRDKYNVPVTDKKYVQVISQEILSPLVTGFINDLPPTAEKGEIIKYRVMSNLDSLYLVHQVTTNEAVATKVENTIRDSYQVAIPQHVAGNISVIIAFIKNNRVYTDMGTTIVAPMEHKLKIEYLSFRNKTEPGASEKWNIKISGMNGEKIAAELLTAMYDASLDQFYPHSWQVPPIWNTDRGQIPWHGDENFSSVKSIEKHIPLPTEPAFQKIYDRLKTTDDAVIANAVSGRVYGMRSMRRDAVEYDQAESLSEAVSVQKATAPTVAKDEETKADGSTNRQQAPAIQPRKNFNETAFFFPALHTDPSGNISFSFTAPESVTTWKWLLLAHSKDLAFASGEQKMITQKQLMVQPNLPRFLREGDKISLSTKLANLTERELSGNAVLELIDPSTGENVDALFGNNNTTKTFTAAAGEAVPVHFIVNVPQAYTRPLSWRITASTNYGGVALTDGEEAMLPVLSNRMLVTETLPIFMNGAGKKQVAFEKLLQSGESKSLLNHSLTVEYTSNPVWYAVQALPYLTEEKSENAEQVFNRYFANALAAHIASSSPKIRKIISEWKTADTSAFLSNLQKNQELKAVLLQETPWVLEAKTEAQQRKNIALLFDLVRMSGELSTAMSRLKQLQSPGGGFVWFAGGPEDRYMTQYILSGIGHLQQLGAIPTIDRSAMQEIVRKAMVYLDGAIKKDHREIMASKSMERSPSISHLHAQYLYVRSFFPEMPAPADIAPALNYFRSISKKDWVNQNSFMRGMIALALFRNGEKAIGDNIMAALKESAIRHAEFGMYWKDMQGGYYWYQAPIETQSLLIEAFSEISNDSASVTAMKTWLLTNKQTNSWKTSRATADACYALLLRGSDWLTNQSQVTIQLGNYKVVPTAKQAGTGYFKNVIAADAVKASMGKIAVTVKNDKPGTDSAPSWGAVYWQYFDELDQITPAGGALHIEKTLFIEKQTDRGPSLQPLGANQAVKVGDKIKVRIEIRSDRTLEYVHMKDMRASAMEPVNVLSGFRWQGGLGYYESTKDASTNFFFHYLPKGVSIFEYDIFVSHTGSFNNGIATIQCMYAPEFISHSEGIKVNAVQ